MGDQVREKTPQQSIEELTELVRQDERRKAEIVTLLQEIKEGQGADRLAEIAQRLEWIEKYVEANYNLLNTLVQVMASNVANGKRQLNGVQKALAEHALDREKSQLTITAERDAIISGDVKAEGNPDGNKD